MTRVKICGIRKPEDAQAACDAGADALGFVFYAPSPRAVTAEAVAAMLPQVAPLVTTVGLFVDPAEEEVRAVLEHCALDCLQFHGSEDREFCERFRRPYIKAISMRPGVDVVATMEAHPGARAFLLDAWRPDAPGGTGETFDWGRIGRLERPWILAGGLAPENVQDAIRRVAPAAVDVSGGVERQRGEKDPRRIGDFIRAVRDADAAQH